MHGADQKQFLPGFRNIIRDISEAGGSLCRVDEIIDDHGIERLLEVLDLGMVLYQAGAVMFVSAGDFRLYAELLDRVEADDDGYGEDRDDCENAASTEPMAAAE